MHFYTTEYLDELDDELSARHAKRQRKGKRVTKQPKRVDAPLGKVALFDPAAQLGIETEFNPTFHASRFERAWILEYLGPFYEDHYIADALRQVKGGKEATEDIEERGNGSESSMRPKGDFRKRQENIAHP
jgi:hypothetical protein